MQEKNRNKPKQQTADTEIDSRIQTFRYDKPGSDERGSKEIVLLCQKNTMRGAVHVIRKGGEEHLHSHSSIDGFWMVLSGRARFYGEGDVLIGEFTAMQGILVPRGTKYWFESAGDEDLELLQVLCFDPGQGFVREDHAAPKFSKQSLKWFDKSVVHK